MNKSELVALLREPNTLSAKQLDEIKSIVDENPYFLSARLLLAKASKEVKHPQTKKRIASAAVYSTDRALLKKYLSGNLFFLSKPEVKPERKKVVTAPAGAKEEPKPQESSKEAPKREDKRPSALKPEAKKETPEVPSVPAGDLDAILEELKQDMQNLKSSRAHFVEVQENIKDEKAVDTPEEAASELPDTEPIAETTEEPEVASQDAVEAVTEEIPEPKEAVTATEKPDKALEEAAAKVKEEIKEQEEKEQANNKEEEKAVELAPKKAATKKSSTTKKAAAKKSSKKVSPEEEDEAVSKKLAELAKKQAPTKETKTEDKKVDEPATKSQDAVKEPKETASKSKKTTAKKLNEKEVEAPNAKKDEPTRATKKSASAKKEDKAKEEAPKAQKASKKKEVAPETPSADESAKTSVAKAPPAKEKPSSGAVKAKDDEGTGERAEDPFRESRFDKDATRSYLKALEVPDELPPFDTGDEDDLPDDDTLDLIPPEEEKADDKPTADKVTTKKKEEAKPKAKKEGKAKEEPEATKDETPATESPKEEKEPPKEETKPKEPKSTASAGSSMPKGSTMKKAKLVKSKRSSRRSGGAKLPKSDKGNEDDGKSDRASQTQIIDKFIEEAPSIKYSRESEPSTSDLAETSGTWDKNLASEYLAEIYLKQGNKKRAIEIYEVLSLKYPEKKSYFADLISKSK